MYVYIETEYSKTKCMHPQPHVCNMCTGNKKSKWNLWVGKANSWGKHIFCALYGYRVLCRAGNHSCMDKSTPYSAPVPFSVSKRALVLDWLWMLHCSPAISEACLWLLPQTNSLSQPFTVCITLVLESWKMDANVLLWLKVWRLKKIAETGWGNGETLHAYIAHN